MGAAPLYTLVFLIFFGGIFAVEGVALKKNTLHARSSASASAFILYRDAVMSYAISNPTYLGSAPINWNGVTGGNAIVQTGQGRSVICYAVLPGGSLSDALRLSSNDASLGVAVTTSTWSSYMGGSLQTLPITVPQGSVVAYVQI